MEKYQVNIELSSIKKNKDAGQTTTVISGRKTVSFEAYQLPEYFKHEENCIINEWTEIDGIKKDFKGVIISEDLIQKCIDEKPNVNISVDFEHQYINHMPIPEYSYDYENTKVNCNDCGKEIFIKDLKAYEFWDGENEYYSNEICPECGALDCCDLIYESIEDALKPVQCKNCKHYEEDKNYKGEGKCNNDGRYTREHRVCNLLDTDKKRRNAKIRR